MELIVVKCPFLCDSPGDARNLEQSIVMRLERRPTGLNCVMIRINIAPVNYLYANRYITPCKRPRNVLAVGRANTTPIRRSPVLLNVSGDTATRALPLTPWRRPQV